MLGCRLAYPASRFAREKMKQTVISLDLEDIFTMMDESATKLFSKCRMSADTAAALCEIRTCYAGPASKFWGRVVAHITASPEFTLAEVQQILSAIKECCSGDLIWGFELDDATDQITVNMFFEVEPS